MDCPSFEQISMWLDEDPPSQAAQEFEEHVVQCLPCRRAADEWRRTVRTMESAMLWAEPQQRATNNHLSETDMLFALAKAGGGIHLKECHDCQDEATIIEQAVEAFESGELAPAAKSLRSRIKQRVRESQSGLQSGLRSGLPSQDFKIHSGPKKALTDSTDIAIGPMPAVEAGRRARRASESSDSRRRRNSRRSTGRRRRVGAGSTRRQRQGAMSLVPMLSGLAAAAALLLLAVLMASGPNTGSQNHGQTAKNDPRPKRGQLVSDTKLSGTKPGDQSNPQKPTKDPHAPFNQPDSELPDSPFPDTKQPDSENSNQNGHQNPGQRPADANPVENQPENGPRHSSVSDGENKPAAKPDANKKQAENGENNQPQRPTPEQAFANREISDDGGRLVIASSRLVGRVAIRRKGKSSWEALKRGSEEVEVGPGDALIAKGGPAFLTLESGTDLDLCLGKETEVLIEGAKDGPVLGLGKGQIHCEFDRRFSPQVFVVHTPYGQTTSAGSTFSMDTAKGQTLTHVYEGRMFSQKGRSRQGVALEAGRAYRLKAGESAKTIGRARPARWGRKVLPRREILFSCDFERGINGFRGTLVQRDDKTGKGLEGLSISDNKYFGTKALLRRGGFRSFRATEGLKLRFSYRMDSDAPLLVQGYNVKQRKNFRKDFGVQTGGLWQRTTIDIMNDFSTYYAPGKNPVGHLDLFDQIEFFAGRPGQKLSFVIDNVEIYRKVYR